MAIEYDRYSKFRTDNKIEIVPFAEVPKCSGDFYELYEKGRTRLDQVSHKYYGDSSYGWLIMQANPEYGSMEFSIPDSTMLRIPFPLAEAIQGYKENIDKYNKLYKK